MSTASKAVGVGETVPDISSIAVAAGRVQELSLRTYRGSGHYLVLLFLPVKGPAADKAKEAAGLFEEFAAVPPTMVAELHDKYKTYLAGVVDASSDEVLRWTDQPIASKRGGGGGLQGLPFPVVCDPGGKFSSHFAGVWNREAWLMHRAHVIIDSRGVVRQLTVNDALVSRSVLELYRQVTAFKFTDEHGEVCPAEWNSGDTTMEPDPQGSKKYFREKFPQ